MGIYFSSVFIAFRISGITSIISKNSGYLDIDLSLFFHWRRYCCWGSIPCLGSWLQLSTSAGLGRQQATAQVTGFLPPWRETWMGLPFAASAWPHPGHCSIGELTSRWEPCLSHNKWMNTKRWHVPVMLQSSWFVQCSHNKNQGATWLCVASFAEEVAEHQEAERPAQGHTKLHSYHRTCTMSLQ